MKTVDRMLVPISEEEMEMAYGVRCGTCQNCKQVNEIGLGPTCCKHDCILGFVGSFLSKEK